MPGKDSQTSLNTQLTLILTGLFLVASIAIIVFVNVYMKKQALNEANEKSLIILERNLATHKYFARDLKPGLFRLTAPCRPDGFFDPTWMSSTFAVRQIDRYFKEIGHQDYYYKECAINARNPENEADGFEHEFIDRLNSDPDLVEQAVIREMDGRPYWVILRRGEVMEESCLQCHSAPGEAPLGLVSRYGPDRSFHRKQGDVVSAVSIRIPLATAYESANHVTMIISFTLLALLLALFVIKYHMYKRLVFLPLNAIREMVTRISTGEKPLGEQIPLPAGRELSELTEAFNRMSDKLRDDKEHLEKTVDERTATLSLVNDQLQVDIAARKKTENELRLAQNKKSELYAMVSHDLKTPLMVISGNAGFLLEKYKDSLDEDQKEMITSIVNSCEKQKRMFEGFITISRLEDGVMKPDKVPTDAGEILEMNKVRFMHIARQKGIKITVETAAGLPMASMDRELIDRAVSNLLKNAIAYTDTGEVALRAVMGEGDDAGFVALSVSDTGPGIDPKEQARVFEKYFRSKTSTSVDGTGLGLAIVKAVAEAHGGRVTLKSREGEGSVFTILLPTDV